MAIENGTTLRSVDATVNYYPPDGPKVFYPGTAGYQRRKFDSRVIPITDLRGAEGDYNLYKNGFQVVKSEWTDVSEEEDSSRVKEIVYKETVAMLKNV